MSQENLAEAAQLHPTYISDIERGQANASICNYARVANALGVSLADLVEGTVADVALKMEMESIERRVFGLGERKREIFLETVKVFLSGIETV